MGNIVNINDFNNELMNKNINSPKSLYRYRKGTYENGECRDINSLNNDEIWLSLATTLDDPFDCKVLLKPSEVNPVIFKRFSNITNTPIENINPELVKILGEDCIKNINIQSRTYVACFSDTYKSGVMWNYYANEHRGFCIEYDFEELFNYIPMQAQNENRAFLPIIYTKNKNINGLMAAQEILLKNNEWSFQGEWRIIVNKKNETRNHFPIVLNELKPKSIILGYKASENKKMLEDIEKYCDKKKVEIKSIKLNDSEFGI